MPFKPAEEINRRLALDAHDDVEALRALLKESERRPLPLYHSLDVDGAYYEARLVEATQRGDREALAVLMARQQRFKSLAPRRGAMFDPLLPWETVEQADVADYLDRVGLLWAHVPNERSSRREAGILAAQGVKSGVPDIIIFSPCRLKAVRGVAIELKRRRAPPCKVHKNQRAWIAKLREQGWLAFVARGAGEAVAIIELLFGVSWPKGADSFEQYQNKSK